MDIDIIEKMIGSKPARNIRLREEGSSTDDELSSQTTFKVVRLEKPGNEIK